MSQEASLRRLVCLSNEAETADIRSFTFRPEDGLDLPFRPGQALTLALEMGGCRVFRTFSIASAPGTGNTLTLTVKAQPGAGATRWMHANLAPGTIVEVRGPHGRFHLADTLPERIALVSAGSGAAPLMAMLRFIAGSAPDTDLAWFHVARRPADILFAAELARLETAMPRLSVAVTLTRPAPGWVGYRGRASRRLLSTAIPDLGRRDVFCCGPASFMHEVRLVHAAEGGAAVHFHVENFGPVAVLNPVPAAQATGQDSGYQVRLNKRSFGVNANETILEAATRQVVVIPCGCASGICGTCRVRCLEGSVTMQHQGGLAPDEEAEGYILACSARPLSDLVLAF